MKTWSRVLIAVSCTGLVLVLSQACTKTALFFSENKNLAAEAPPVPETSFSLGAEWRPRTLDRYALRSILIDIFGPSVVGVVQTEMFYKTGPFGGSCDKSEGFMTNEIPPNFESPDSPCFDPEETQAPMLALSNVVREGYRIQICQLIATDDNAVRFATEKVLGAVTPLSLPQTSNADDRTHIASAYHLFFPFQDPSPEVIDDLIAVANAPDDDGTLPTPRKAWGWIFLTLCLSPEWQVF